eukprot:scaffold50058_cov60-Phaeocystis_antarctica.AAC.5
MARPRRQRAVRRRPWPLRSRPSAPSAPRGPPWWPLPGPVAAPAQLGEQRLEAEVGLSHAQSTHGLDQGIGRARLAHATRDHRAYRARRVTSWWSRDCQGMHGEVQSAATLRAERAPRKRKRVELKKEPHPQ